MIALDENNNCSMKFGQLILSRFAINDAECFFLDLSEHITYLIDSKHIKVLTSFPHEKHEKGHSMFLFSKTLKIEQNQN
jgi:hypothetical protein